MLISLRLLYGLVLLAPLLASAGNWQAQSGDRQLAVLELFTAEGCGQCPAAYDWLERLPQQGFGDDRLIVLSFHVDYLDQQKGWIDPFAQAEFSERQKQLARINLFNTVFTPEFFISGEVVYSWREHALTLIDFVADLRPQADIALAVAGSGQQLAIRGDIQVRGADNREHAKLYLAVTEDDVSSDVRGGDNAGRRFLHRHLVRSWIGPFELDASGTSRVETDVELDADWKRQDLKLVALVQNLDDGFVLQALSLPLAQAAR